jgi:predicted RecA/RadA family phage recombinase
LKKRIKQMAKNLLQEGDVLSLSAPRAVTSGELVLFGALATVALSTLASGEIGAFKTTGVFELPKPSPQEWAIGDKIYWDDTDKICVKMDIGNTLIGVAVAVAANPSSAGAVRLNGCAVA